MMKYRWCYLLLCICLLLAGCASNISLESTTQSKVSIQPTHTLTDGMNCIGGRTGIGSHDEYQKFIETSVLPEGFVEYDTVSHFGTFNSFYCNTMSEGGYYNNNHGYTVKDPAGILFEISIRPNENEPLVHSVSATPDLSDMRWLNSNETGLYRYGDVFYQYICGKLYNIKWRVDGVEIQVRPVHSEMENGYYPYVDTTVFGKLMNIQDKTPEEVMQFVLNG